MEDKNNIKHDAYYLINKFNQNGQDVTNLQIQKLMYFFEAYYMNIYDNIDRLYECDFNAWAFGPVAIPLYKEFKKFGNERIILTDDNRKKGDKIAEEKKKLLADIYLTFKDISAELLVEWTKEKDSPCYKVWERNGRKVGYGADTKINKLETKQWFEKEFKLLYRQP